MFNLLRFLLVDAARIPPALTPAVKFHHQTQGIGAYRPRSRATRHVEGIFRRRYFGIEVPRKDAASLKTRRDIERYFGGKTIQCLLCRQRFRRLGGHLAAKHEVSVDEYRSRFGLPWTRGLTSAASVASSGWTDERKAKARKLARRNRFFERAHLTPRRAPAPFLKAEAIQNLGKHAVGFGKAFERRVRALFYKGLTDAAIALALDVGRATVTYRTMHWRKRKRFK